MAALEQLLQLNFLLPFILGSLDPKTATHPHNPPHPSLSNDCTVRKVINFNLINYTLPKKMLFIKEFSPTGQFFAHAGQIWIYLFDENSFVGFFHVIRPTRRILRLRALDQSSIQGIDSIEQILKVLCFLEHVECKCQKLCWKKNKVKVIAYLKIVLHKNNFKIIDLLVIQHLNKILDIYIILKISFKASF